MINDLIISKETYHKDERGYTFTTWREGPIKYVQDKVITGKKGSLRGFHGDNLTGKLITCLEGSFLLAVIDLRDGPTFLHKRTIKLSKKNRKSVYCPAGVVNAHQGLSRYVLYYKWTHPYDLSNQISIRWDSCGIKWPHEPILSERDKTAPTLKEYLSEKN